MPAKHLIFDFDGTLIDSSPAILETLGAVLHAHAIPPARPLTRAIIGPPLLATLQLCSGVNDRGLLERLAADFRSRYDAEGIYATEAYPEVAPVLQRLHADGRDLHIATNKRQRPTLLLLRHFGWENWFRSVYCVDSRTPPYPRKGDMLEAQLAEQKLDQGATIYIGDTAHDEAAASQAGLSFLAAAWGYGIGEQAVSPTARLVRSPRELIDSERHN